MFIWSIVTIAVYLLISKGLRNSPLARVNPIVTTLIVLIGLVVLTKTAYVDYKAATDWITFLLGPIVVMLALPLYKNRLALKENFQAVMIGVVSSMIFSTITVILGCFVFGLNNSMLVSMLPKSITTPMAIEVTKLLQGQTGLTIVFVILTGISGASLAPYTLEWFKIKHKISMGIGIGTSSHGIGTSKAVEMDDEIGAASGLAMGIAGVVTVLTFSFLASIFL